MKNCNEQEFEEIQVFWPNEPLGPKYANYSTSPIKYKHLDSRLFIAAQLNVIYSKKICEDERICRLNMLCDTVFNMEFYEWPAILKLHAAILTEIESDSKTWNSDFSRQEQQMLMPFPLQKEKLNR